MDLTVNKTTAWSVELESTFTSCAEPGEWKAIMKVHKIIESHYLNNILFSCLRIHPSLTNPFPLPCLAKKVKIANSVRTTITGN